MALWTYGALSAAWGAVMVMVPPPPRVIVMLVNIGLPRARSEVPGVSGKKPSADQTYQALIVPRSSLPTPQLDGELGQS